MERSASVATGLTVAGLFGIKTSLYQKCFLGLNIAIILSSVCFAFYSGVLIKAYYLDKLDFSASDQKDQTWWQNFPLLPWVLVGVGMAAFVVSAYGFVISSLENKWVFIVYGVLLSAVLISTVAVTFLAQSVREQIKSHPDWSAGKQEMKRLYHQIDDQGNPKNPEFISNWNEIYQGLRCCGSGVEIGQGFRDHTTQTDDVKKALGYQCVPTSCCLDPDDCKTLMPNMQKCQKPDTTKDLTKLIYIHGCFEIMTTLYNKDLVPGLMILAIASIAVAVLEIAAVAVSFAFVARIRRKEKRYQVANSAYQMNERETVM